MGQAPEAVSELRGPEWSYDKFTYPAPYSLAQEGRHARLGACSGKAGARSALKKREYVSYAEDSTDSVSGSRRPA